MNRNQLNKLRLIILDRDGVINLNSKAYIKSVAEWQPIAGSLAAIAQLKKAGFLMAIATNQSGIGRGYYTRQTLSRIHEKMAASLARLGASIDQIEFCPHAPEENCPCRKPKSAMLETIGRKLAVAPDESLFIGDSLKDLQAARHYGCTGFLVRTGYGVKTARQVKEQQWQLPVFADLKTAAQYIIDKRRNEKKAC